MYSESDLDAAVEAGALSPAAASAFRDHIAASRSAPAVDEESFRLLTGFNDIFVAIAAAAMLVGMAWLGGTAWVPLGGLGVAVTSWALAEYFTRKRRMALPSILLMLAFVGGVAATLIGLLVANDRAVQTYVESNWAGREQEFAGVLGAAIGCVTAFAAWVHWKRFMVPITVAAGAVALVGVVIALIIGFVPGAEQAVYPMVLAAGVLMFGLAMAWDMSDLERRTRRSDVAFWLHLAAAPMMAHSIFHLLGVFDGEISPAMAGVVIALYIGFAIVALAVDRRALLVSSLAYVLYALYALFQTAGAVELGAALTALVIGSALLTLSAFWQPMRRQVVRLLGKSVEERLPPTRQIAIA